MAEHRTISSKEIYESFKTIYVLIFGLNASTLLFTMGMSFQSLSKNMYTYRFMFELSGDICMFILGSIFILFTSYGMKVGYRYGVFYRYAQEHKKGFFKTVLFFEHLSLVVLIFSTVYFLIKLKLNYTYVYF